jgi:hypothetical protein
MIEGIFRQRNLFQRGRYSTMATIGISHIMLALVGIGFLYLGRRSLAEKALPFEVRRGQKLIGYPAIITGRFFVAAGILCFVSVVIPIVFIIAMLTSCGGLWVASYYAQFHSID